MADSIRMRAVNWWRQLQWFGASLVRGDTQLGPSERSPPPWPAPRRAIQPAQPNARPDYAPGSSCDYVDLFEHAPVGYMRLDSAGSIENINRAGAELLGWDEAWLHGKPFSRWVLNNDKQLFHSHQLSLSADEHNLSQELRIKNRQGQGISLRLQSSRVTTASGKPGGYRSIMVDISGEEQSARRLRQLQSQLAHVARLQTAGELATSLAHELNQPLGTVVLNCEAALRLLNSGAAKDYEFAEALTQATQAASFASEVIRHLRGFLSDGEDLHKVCGLGGLIADITSLIETDAWDNQIELRMDVAPDLASVRVNSIQIEQVLVNLVRNSIEAIGVGASLPRQISISAASMDNKQLCVSVADTGPGLDARQTERIFTPFFTTKRGGMGMGLSISRTIIEAHGGKLWADSNAGSGATIHFTLPTVETQAYA